MTTIVETVGVVSRLNRGKVWNFSTQAQDIYATAHIRGENGAVTPVNVGQVAYAEFGHLLREGAAVRVKGNVIDSFPDYCVSVHTITCLNEGVEEQPR